MNITVIKNRDGDIITFDRSRIERVIEKAAESVGRTQFDFVDELTDVIIERLEEHIEKFDHETFVTIENIQDQVELELMNAGYFDVMKHFIIYRSKRAELREKQKEKVEKKLSENTLKIVKSDGKKEVFDLEKVKKTYKIVSF